jgi:hypothetical protein
MLHIGFLALLTLLHFALLLPTYRDTVTSFRIQHVIITCLMQKFPSKIIITNYVNNKHKMQIWTLNVWAKLSSLWESWLVFCRPLTGPVKYLLELFFWISSPHYTRSSYKNESFVENYSVSSSNCLTNTWELSSRFKYWSREILQLQPTNENEFCTKLVTKTARQQWSLRCRKMEA